MDMIVCVKHVPETAEEEIIIKKDGKGIQTEDLVFDINEWDDYAIEEAVLIKEKLIGIDTGLYCFGTLSAIDVLTNQLYQVWRF